MTEAAASSALPGFWELQAPCEWAAIEFISDLHLGPDTPATFDAWLNYLHRTDADAIFILGDLFEVWVGDDARHEGFEKLAADGLAEAACQRTLGFMAGNRDFLLGTEMLKACGVMALLDPTVLQAFGQRALLTHGDALCLDDRDYQQFRSMVRSAPWQRDFLRQPLAQRRRLARQLRDQSEARKQATVSPLDWADIDGATAVRWLHEAGASILVHGHTHQPGSEPLAPGFVRHVLSDWDLDHLPHRAQVLRWTSAGFKRLSPPTGPGLDPA